MEDLFARIAAGDANARSELIDQAQGLAKKRVAYRLRKLPSLSFYRDDLEAVALFALVEATHEMMSKQIEKPRQYLEMAIDRAIGDAILKEENQAYSPRTQQRALANGDALDSPNLVSLTDDLPDKSGSTDDLLDLILSCCLDDVDRRIVQLRRENRTFADVARTINMTASAVRARVSRLETRFKELNDE